ncbi:MAG TPA: hypothetical protein VGQ24_03840 [Gemmatimonadales bacterium]|nr:hypothetical protein [Gemmatimonadales bacterium]
MTRRTTFLALLILSMPACRPGGEGVRDPGKPTPVAGPAVGPAASPQTGRPGPGGAGGLPEEPSLPGRADQAPLVRVQEALAIDSLLGRRVRVAGRCTAAGEGRRAGSWTLEDAGSSIEVRGLVPSSCAAQSSAEVVIFAQIEPASSGSRERLLLRLPD